MINRLFRFRNLAGTVVIAALFMLSSCENDLRDVERISSRQVSNPVDRSYGVEIIYSDSAEVKAKMFAPELLYHKVANPYYQMPKGVRIIFYDAMQQEENIVTADSAIKRENEKVTQLMGHVLIRKRDGTIFKSDELFWDENTRKFYSNKLVTVIAPNGDEMNGYGFKSDEKLYYELSQGTGNFMVPDKK